MSIQKKLATIDKLKAEIDSLGKLPKEVLNRINYRFRLDWNYYSNIMEGNTLSMRETRSIMIGNITVDGKPIKDVLEMKGHDEAIQQIIKIGKGELNLSENRIKSIHQAIMHEDDDEKKKEIGQWKKADNYILNYRNERFDFVHWEDVPDKMHGLINWLSSQKEKIESNSKDQLHPAILAIEFHLRYLTIHPFYDGNGRTARIIMNLILISLGYPPIIIRSDDKAKYYQYLADIQGYNSPSDFYHELMLDLLARSLDLVKQAAAGGDISYPDDIDKKLALLEKELEAVDPDDQIKKQLNGEVLNEIRDSWFVDLMNKAIPAVQKFNRFFDGNRHWISIQNGIGSVDFNDEPASEILEKLRADMNANSLSKSYYDCKIVLNTGYGPFIKGGLQSFGANYGFEIRFDKIKYEIYVDHFSTNQRTSDKLFDAKLLHKQLSEKEIDMIVNKLTETIYEHIDYYTKKSGLR